MLYAIHCEDIENSAEPRAASRDPHRARLKQLIIEGRLMVDLAYEEDSEADVDMNVVMTGSGRFVEVQGTAERMPFTASQMERMMALAAERIRDICALQRSVLAEVGVVLPGRKG